MDPIALDLNERSFSIRPGFFSAEKISEIQNDLLSSRQLGRMKSAGIGKASGVDQSVRRDEIMWLDNEHPTGVQAALLEELDTLRQNLNRQLFLNLRSFEGHYAHYSAGGFYRRHLDRFRADDARTVTAVLYLNPDWQISDGGILRLYSGEDFFDVEPIAGTLAVFLSGEIEHEVLESRAPRLTFTGWFKT